MTPWPSDLTSLSRPELEKLFWRTTAGIRLAEARIEPPAARRRRNVRLLRGTALTFIGLAAAIPTGFVSLGLSVVGLLDWAEALKEDAEGMGTQLELWRQLGDYRRRLEALAAEFHRSDPRDNA